jgi:ribosome biogenesis SPOUT family RNA methylase Rps3
MRTLGGPGAHVHFTHLSLPPNKVLSAPSDDPTLAQASFHSIGILDLMKQHDVSLDQVCLLDPKATAELSPEDGDGRFQWFLFGVQCDDIQLIPYAN